MCTICTYLSAESVKKYVRYSCKTDVVICNVYFLSVLMSQCKKSHIGRAEGTRILQDKSSSSTAAKGSLKLELWTENKNRVLRNEGSKEQSEVKESVV